jgi:hypothetical protein
MQLKTDSLNLTMGRLACLAGPNASASGFDDVQPSFLVGCVLCCCSPTAPSLGLLVLSSTVVFDEHGLLGTLTLYKWVTAAYQTRPLSRLASVRSFYERLSSRIQRQSSFSSSDLWGRPLKVVGTPTAPAHKLLIIPSFNWKGDWLFPNGLAKPWTTFRLLYWLPPAQGPD